MRCIRTPLAYQVVFQKGILGSVQVLESEREEALLQLTGKTHGGEKATRGALTSAWLERFNDRIAPRLDDYDFWRGFGVRLDGNIDFTRASPPAISGFVGLAMIAPFGAWSKAPSKNNQTPEQQLLFSLVRGASIGEGLTVAGYGGANASQQYLAANWLFEQSTYVRGGRMTEPYGQVVRSLAGPWLRSVERYLGAAARAEGLEINDEGRLMAAVHGGRRLAAVKKALS